MSKAKSVSEGLQPGSVTGAGAGALKGFWPWWILLTTLGYAVGLGLDEALYSSTGTALSGIAAGVGNVALYGAVTGGVSGTLQALLLRRWIERSHLWALASMAGGAIGFILGTAAGEAASNAIGLHLNVYTTGAIITAGAIIEFLYGAFCGAGIGVAQWLLIRRRIHNAGVWVPASILGLMFGSTIPGALWLVLRAPVRGILGSTLGSSIPGIMQVISLPFWGVWLGAGAGLLLGLTQWLWARRIAW
jgi:hypothetical protein